MYNDTKHVKPDTTIALLSLSFAVWVLAGGGGGRQTKAKVGRYTIRQYCWTEWH